MIKKPLATANIIAFIITVFMNYISNTGVFNGNTMSTVSAKYDNLFTPAGYAFSIWGLIYIALLSFVIFQGRSLFKKINAEADNTVMQIGWWFVISSIANCLWIVTWLYDYTGLSVLIMLLLLFSLIKIIIKTEMELYNVSIKKVAFVWWPFCLYSGWITVALIANIAAYLTKTGWERFGLSENSWALIMICVAGLINLFMTWNRNMREFALVGAWGLVAVAVANWNGHLLIAIVSLTVATVLFISSIVHGIRNFKGFSYK